MAEVTLSFHLSYLHTSPLNVRKDRLVAFHGVFRLLTHIVSWMCVSKPGPWPDLPFVLLTHICSLMCVSRLVEWPLYIGRGDDGHSTTPTYSHGPPRNSDWKHQSSPVLWDPVGSPEDLPCMRNRDPKMAPGVVGYDLLK